MQQSLPQTNFKLHVLAWVSGHSDITHYSKCSFCFTADGELLNLTELLVSEGLVEVRRGGIKPSEWDFILDYYFTCLHQTKLTMWFLVYLHSVFPIWLFHFLTQRLITSKQVPWKVWRNLLSFILQKLNVKSNLTSNFTLLWNLKLSNQPVKS